MYKYGMESSQFYSLPFGQAVQCSYNQLQKWWDTPTEKRRFLLQIAPSHRSVKYNTDLLPPIQSCSSKFWVWSCIASNFDKGWREDHKHKIMDRPFMPKYGTVSQVLLQLVVACTWLKVISASLQNNFKMSIDYSSSVIWIPPPAQ